MSFRLPQPQFTREHRLGLVVYGGVSLAIYMNGICQEFYNAVRGRGLYKLIKALTDADITVDIISGTSAGGINGVLLGYALSNSSKDYCVPFEEFANIWIESGDIKKLLFNRDYDGYYKTSFFDGVNYYKSQLKQALEERQQQEAPRSDWFSPSENLDLFVTGTDLLGRIYETFDNTGRIIEVKDHRTIFHLKCRESGENAFEYQNEVTCEALAKLCQITSCFPGAFPPVTVQIGNKGQIRTQKSVDELLVQWGQLRKNRLLPKLSARQRSSIPWDQADPNHQKVRAITDDDLAGGYRLHFVDGGVLDNRPFTYAIETIYQRTSERRVFRKLFYVDPSPDRFLDNNRYRQMMKPGPMQVIADSLSALPRYESINNDLELIKQHNEKVRRYKFLLSDIEALLDGEVPDLQNEDLRDQQVYVYKRARLLKLKDKLVSKVYLESEDCLQDLEDEIQQTGNTDSKDYQQLHHQELSNNFQSLTEELTARLDIDPELIDNLDAAHEQISHLLKLDRELSARRDLDKAVELLTKPLEPDENAKWVEYLEIAYQETSGLDIEYSLRKHFFIVNYIHELLDSHDLCKWFNQKLDHFSKNLTEKPEESLSETDITKLQEAASSLSNKKAADQLNKFVHWHYKRKFPPQDLSKQEILKIQECLKYLKNIPSIDSSSHPCERELQALSKDIQALANNLRILVRHLNRCLECIQDINEEVERFFSSRLVSKYFKNLIAGIEGCEPKNHQFPFEFYKVMCFLHKSLLYIERPTLSEELNLSRLTPELLSVRNKLLSKLTDNRSPLREISALKGLSIEEVVARVVDNIATSGEYGNPPTSKNEISILHVFSFIAEKLIDDKLSSQSSEDNDVSEMTKFGAFLQNFLKERLKKYFIDFKKLDEFLFPLDYLAGISEKQIIETYRISPEDARYGFSTFIKRGKRLEQKLAGDSLLAFGGFLKQSWRENDILWGRLDGLNRIVESLITDEQIKRFPDFWEQQAKQVFHDKELTQAKEDYLDCLLDEALSIRCSDKPCDKSKLKQQLKRDLKDKIKKLSQSLTTQTMPGQVNEREIAKCRAMLVQSLVRAGHLLILDEEQQSIKALGDALSKQPERKYNVNREDERMEAAFRDHYKIGSETLQDIPPADWKEIRTRGIAIAQDIIRTYRHKRYKRFEPAPIRYLLKRSNKLVKLIDFALSLLIYAAIILILGLPLIFIIFLRVIVPPVLKLVLNSRNFRRLRITLFKYLVVLENILLSLASKILIPIFREAMSLYLRWNSVVKTKKSRPYKKRS